MSAADFSPALLDGLLDQLVERLAPRIADELAARLTPQQPASVAAATLLDLDGLIAELPRTKKPETWRAWLYEHLRRGEVSGAYKIGGRWHFNRDEVREWLGLS